MKSITIDYDEMFYTISVEVVETMEPDTYGRYIPEEKKILLLNGCDDSTIYHEAIHATIDMFRSTKEDFTDLFCNTSVYGEEAFCHYVCEIATKIKESIK